MGREYLNFDIMDIEKAAAAFHKTLELLEPKDVYYANALSALEVCELYSKNRDNAKKHISAVAYDFRMYCGNQKLYSQPGFSISISGFFSNILYYATEWVNILTCKAGVGETVREQSHSVTLLSNTETVQTPAGSFDNCELWKTENINFYIKPGVGIVKCVPFESCYDGCEVLPGEYRIKSGGEKMPFGVGNSWTYVSATPESISFRENYEVIYAKTDERVVLSSFTDAERVKYNENSWKDMKLKLRTDYYTLAEHAERDEWDCDGRMRNDVLETLQRLKKLADTPYEKLFSDKADSVMRRLIASNPNLVSDCKEVGIWNFFNAYKIDTGDGTKTLDYKNYHFEWKWWYGAAYMLLHNFLLEELSNCGAVWDDDWKPGYCGEKTSYKYGEKITAAIRCEDGGTVTTAAGAFENCLKVTVDFSGFSESHNYMNGKKEYFFAKGIGIVKCIHYIGGAVYELTGYEGTGEGYMPLEDGILRHYEGVDFPDGMRGSVDFVCAADDLGQLIMIVDQLGQQSREDWNNSDQPEKRLSRKSN